MTNKCVDIKRRCNKLQSIQRSKTVEQAVKIVQRVLERRIRELVHVDAMQLGFMPGREKTDALFVVRRLQDEYRDKKKKLYMCFEDIQKAFHSSTKGDGVGDEKKGLAELIVRAVMSLHHGAKTKVRVGSELYKEFLVQVDVIKDLRCRRFFLELQWM